MTLFGFCAILSDMISNRVSEIQGKISSVCKHLGRNPREVTLIGVTKFAPQEKIEAAIQAGITHIAENKVQEAQKKFPELKKKYPNITCHLIGHLQTNKVKDVLKVCDLIQSVDSLKLAQEIEKQAEKLGKTADILVQVKTSGEEQKFGTDPAEALQLVEQISKLKNIRILGLMTMAPFIDDKTIVRACFKQLREIRDEAVKKFQGLPNVQMKYLSMGMTEDFDAAIAEGSNMVRIGRAIFQE